MVRKKNTTGSVADEAKSAVSMSVYHCCKRCARKRQRTTPYLPLEMIFQFLLHLPAQLLHDVMIHVCREWSLVIRSPNFARNHYRNSTGGVLIQSLHSPWEGFYLEMRRGCLEICKFDCRLVSLVRTSCNGLVLVRDFYSTVEPVIYYIANPLTKQSTILPPSSGSCNELGLAFVEASMVYKVVQVCGYKEMTHIAVLTIGVDKDWRHIDLKHLMPSMEERTDFVSSPLVAGGYVHWPTESLVLTLNVETEVVCRFSWPPLRILKGDFLPMGSNLSYIHTPSEVFSDVWEMNSVTGEWTMLFRIRMKPLNDSFEGIFEGSDKSVGPVCWLAAREILVLGLSLGRQRTGIAYNVKTGEFQVFEWEGNGGSFYHLEAHVNSLLWWE